MANSIQVVLFDYGLVLTGPPDAAVWARMRQILRANEAELTAAYWHHRLDYDCGTLTGQAYWTSVAGDLSRTLTLTELNALIAADTALWTQLNPPMVDWALRLHAAGTPTGILSNLGDEMTRGVLETLPWMSGFQHKVWSHTVNLTKPEPAIYRHAIAGLGMVPGSILFIDDRAENVAGALEAGMQAIQYASHDAFLAEMRLRGLTSLWQTGRP